MIKIKFDRITALGASAIFLFFSLFLMNTIVLIAALAIFTILAFYNLQKNVKEDRLFDINKVSVPKQTLLYVVMGVGGFGIAMGFLALILSI